MKQNIKSVVVLSAICLILAAVLAVVNAITAPIIADAEAAAANEALRVVYPAGESFEDVDLADYSGLPTTVSEIKRANDGGYVVKLTTSGHKSGLVIMCGIDPEGKVTGATCLASSETYGYEKTYGSALVGATLDTVADVDTVAGATKTTGAYRNAVRDALGAVAIIGGGSFDSRSELEIALDNALPAAEGKFTDIFFAEDIADLTAVFKADNGTGYVFVFGDEMIGTDNSGAAVTNTESDKAAGLPAALAAIGATEYEQLDISGLGAKITKVERTASGNYVFTASAAGYASQNKYAPEELRVPIVIKVAVTAEGRIICCMTVSHAESEGFGDVCGTYEYYSQYNGKNSETLSEVDAISGATKTSVAYSDAIAAVLSSLETVKGGTAE